MNGSDTSPGGVLAAVRRVMRNERHGIDDDLLSSGADSLRLVEVAEILTSHLGRDVQINDIWNSRTLRALLSRRDAAAHEGCDSSDTVGARPARHLAAPQQRRLYAMCQSSGVPLPHVVVSCRNSAGSSCDVAAATVFLRRLIRKYDALQMRFERDDDGLWQVRADNMDCMVNEVDLRGQHDRWRGAYNALLAREAERTYDPGTWPLFRCYFVRAPGRWIFLMHASHLVFDGTSRAIVNEEFQREFDLCNDSAATFNETLDFNYSHYSDWANRRSKEVEGHKSQYWDRMFDGGFALTPLTSPTQPRDADARANVHVFRLGRALKKAIRRDAAKYSTTEFTILLSGFLSYLLKDQDDVKVGVTVSGRNHLLARKLIGMFTTTLFVWVRQDEARQFPSLVKLVHERLVDAQANQAFQDNRLSRLLACWSPAGTPPVTGVYFNMVANDLSVSRMDQDDEAHDQAGGRMMSDLELHYEDDADDLVFNAMYRCALFSKETISVFCRGFRNHLRFHLLNA